MTRPTPDMQPYNSETDLLHVRFERGTPDIWVSTGAYVVNPLRHVEGNGIAPDRLALKMTRVVLEEALIAIDRQIKE